MISEEGLSRYLWSLTSNNKKYLEKLKFPHHFPTVPSALCRRRVLRHVDLESAALPEGDVTEPRHWARLFNSPHFRIQFNHKRLQPGIEPGSIPLLPAQCSDTDVIPLSCLDTPSLERLLKNVWSLSHLRWSNDLLLAALGQEFEGFFLIEATSTV